MFCCDRSHRSARLKLLSSRFIVNGHWELERTELTECARLAVFSSSTNLQLLVGKKPGRSESAPNASRWHCALKALFEPLFPGNSSRDGRSVADSTRADRPNLPAKAANAAAQYDDRDPPRAPSAPHAFVPKTKGRQRSPTLRDTRTAKSLSTSPASSCTAPSADPDAS